ncbi:TetR/AcrR family transcriptional regulator [Streptomyces sp. Y7]|uniref:TetR/AcrR family transcriptional regulator n=1 Tax=Streptomyces sp. Y7 TaxID=3342392 RepID=UPI003717C3A8
MVKTTRPRGRPPKDADPAPMEDVLQAALHSFATHGFNGVSVRTLNRELGVSHNLLHQRYGSKEAVWRAAVDWGFGRLVARLLAADDEAAPPLERLRAFIRTFVEVAADHPELLRLMNIEGAEAGERLDYIAEHYIEPQIARFEGLWSELAERGEVKPVPPEVIYFLITSGGGSMFAGRALTERLFSSRPLDPGHRAEYTDQFTDLLMRAVTEG